MKLIIRQCVHCSKEFKTYNAKQKFCGTICAAISIESLRPEFFIFERDGFRCVYCGRTPSEDNIKLVVDHIYPRAKDGESYIWNLATACNICNSSKNAKIFRDEVLLDIHERIKNKNKNLSDSNKNHIYEFYKARYGK